MQKNFQRNTKFEGVVLCLVGNNEKVKDEQAEGTRETCRIETKRSIEQGKMQMSICLLVNFMLFPCSSQSCCWSDVNSYNGHKSGTQTPYLMEFPATRGG